MNIVASLRQAQRRRQAARQLRALDSRLLVDMGIDPDRIDETVKQMAAAQEAAEANAPWDGRAARKRRAPVLTTGNWPYSTRRAA
ncbi:MAG: DUF1127 domain-containing protein [Propylenella sp.]